MLPYTRFEFAEAKEEGGEVCTSRLRMECDVVFFKLPREDVHPSHGLGIYLSTLSISGSVVLVVKWG